MCKNVICLAIGVGGVILGGKIISNLADKNTKTKELKEKIKNEHTRRKEFDLEIVTDILETFLDMAAPYKEHPIPFDDAVQGGFYE